MHAAEPQRAKEEQLAKIEGEEEQDGGRTVSTAGVDDDDDDDDDDDVVEEEEEDEDSSYYYGGGGSGGMTVVSVGHRPSLLRYHTHLLEALPLSQSPSRRGGGADDREGQARRFASLRPEWVFRELV